MHIHRPLLTLAMAAFLAAGCAESPTEVPIPAPPGQPLTPQMVAPVGQVLPLPTEQDHRKGVTRLTPEQVSNRIFDATGYRMGDTDEYGLKYDELIDVFGVPLGGIDFIITDKRDPSTKVSTLLTVHSVAWTASMWVVFGELERPEKQRLLFTECALEEDVPDGDAAESARWTAQADAIFWRLFSRAPRADEIDALKLAFNAALQAEGEPFRAWQSLVYSLFSTLEFWTV